MSYTAEFLAAVIECGIAGATNIQTHWAAARVSDATVHTALVDALPTLARVSPIAVTWRRIQQVHGQTTPPVVGAADIEMAWECRALARALRAHLTSAPEGRRALDAAILDTIADVTRRLIRHGTPPADAFAELGRFLSRWPLDLERLHGAVGERLLTRPRATRAGQ